MYFFPKEGHKIHLVSSFSKSLKRAVEQLLRMEETSKFKEYTDFLKNEDFIRWKLTKDADMEKRWHAFIREYPQYEELFKLAVEYSNNIGLNTGDLSSEEKKMLKQRIHASVYTIKYTRKIHRWMYSGVAACIAVLLGITLHYYRTTDKEGQGNEEKAALIIGQALQAEDIYLISGTTTASFKEDIRLKVEKDGSAKILRTDNKEEKIEVKEAIINKLVVPYGKRSKVELADGTQLWLNSGSVLEFPVRFSGTTREVRFSGEMYAEVTKDKTKPFIVHTSGFDVRVYGTKFNISAYQDDTETSCVLVQGCIGIRTPSTAEMRMEDNDRIIYRGDELIKNQVDVSFYTCWKDGYLKFDQTNIVDVLNRIGRYYNLSFDFGDKEILQQRKCSGKIYLSDNIDTVLTTISLLSSTEYKKENQTIFITVNPKN